MSAPALTWKEELPAAAAGPASARGAVLKPVAFQGRLCFAPSDGNRVTFVRPDQWIGPFDRPDPVGASRRSPDAS